ncbi:hypothetical protein [Cohaesibacter celericrescens]|uniref:hypothetical protein n=1 Tax=Cohaesibacter celericrescens TaxID=2067669 RepID=UPI0015E152B2|nr:hypothetical protein [Cohaesibacter celericrescens]
MSDQQAQTEWQFLTMQQQRADSQSLPQLLEKARGLGFSDVEITKLKVMYGSHFEKGNP